MKPSKVTVDAYFNALEEERRETLQRVRGLIHAAWPRIVEDMALGIPTYHLDGEPLCSLAAQKHFMALYIMPYDLLNAFTTDLKVHDTGRSCIRFKRLDDRTTLLFDRIIKYCGTQLATSVHYGKGLKNRPVSGLRTA